MASIIIHPPPVGRTESSGGDSALSVRWYPDAGAEFKEFRVICDACHGLMFTSSSNPSTFDLATLQRQGHPGPFEIFTRLKNMSVGALASVAPGEEGRGRASPPEQWKSGQYGQKVHFDISATPATGYKFLEWTDPGGVCVSTESNFGFYVVVREEEDFVQFYAHFVEADYPYQLGVTYQIGRDSTTGMTPSRFHSKAQSDESKKLLKLYYYGDLFDDQGHVVFSGRTYFADVEGVPTRYRLGNSITVTFNITNSDFWNFTNLRLIGWEIYYSGGLIQTLPASGYTMTFTPDRTGSSATYKICPIVRSANMHVIKLKSVPDNAAELSIQAVGSSKVVKGSGEVSVNAATGSQLILKVNRILQSRAVLHGWSMQMDDYMGGKLLNVPNSDLTVLVYICNHRLLHGAQDKLLYRSPANKLLCGCRVPPGTQVYS